MSWAAVAGAAVGVVGSAIGSDAAGDAADGQAAASRAATAEQQRQFDMIRGDLAPYRDVGPGAVNMLQRLAENYQPLRSIDVMNEPGYQFGLQEGQRTLENSAAARGGLFSGAAGRALTRYGGDYATGRYNDAFNRLRADRQDQFGRYGQLAGIGQSAANQTGAFGQAAAQNIGQIGLSNANAQGAAGIAQGNIWQNALNQLGSQIGRGNWGGSGSNSFHGSNWWAGGDGYEGE